MTEVQNAMTWQGAKQLVDVPKARRFAAWYVAEYRIRNMIKWSTAIIMFGLGNPILYLMSVGIGIGSLVDANLGAGGVGGVSYLTFLAPALLATAAIQGAMDETSFPVLQGFVWDKSFWAMNATQVTGQDIFGGLIIASAMRCIFTVALYEGVLLVFGAIQWSSVPLLTLSAFFAGMAFAAMMGMATSFVKQDDGFFAVVGRFIITPMFMFSGTFYPLDSLPLYLQWIGWISPLWHATNLGRALAYGLPAPGWLLVVHVVYLLAMLAFGMWLGGRQIARRLAK